MQSDISSNSSETIRHGQEMLRKVPTLSLHHYAKGTAEQRATFVTELFRGIKDYGFIILKNHGIDSKLFASAYAVLEKFYALPESEKLKYISKSGGGQRGYTAFGKEHAKDSAVMDLKEFWHVGRELSANSELRSRYPDNLWPSKFPEFKTIFTEIYQSLEQAGELMLEALTGPLEVEKDFFTKMIKDGNSILRLLHYPPIPAGVDPRCLRAAPHEDINLITILPAATTSGLQLKDRDGKWLDVVSEPDALIVDAGDMLSRLCNDVIPSTTHQVVNPQDGTNGHRYSMPFFIHPHPDAILSCLPSCKGSGAKYADISSHDFLMQRLREIGLLK